MSIDASKAPAIDTITLIALPIVFWLAMYVAFRWWSINWRPILPWLNILRWVGWGLGAAVCILSLARNHSFAYGTIISIFTFSAGLSLPQSWVKHRFPPPRNEFNPGESWPSRSE